jgi:hypothetical protein
MTGRVGLQSSSWKTSAVVAYESDSWVSALGCTLHPGGAKLTAHIAQLASLAQEDNVLEIACGRGESVFSLSQKYGCSITGLDMSQKLLSEARNKAASSGEVGRLTFVRGDAEVLPFTDGAFDLVFCECSFSLLPDKKATAYEINRVLKPGGKLAISDVIIRGEFNSEWAEGTSVPPPLAFCFCIAGAMPLESYIRVFEEAGFRKVCTEDHSAELQRLAYRIVANRPAGFFSGSSANRLPGEKSWKQLFSEARPGYAVIIMDKPAEGGCR